MHVVAWPVSVHLLTNINHPVQQPSNPIPRVVGLDVHPDSFTASIIQGPNPLAAVVIKDFPNVPLRQLASWVGKSTLPSDILVLEASGNSFHVARLLIGLGRKALVLESAHLGKLKVAHANNDRISALRIAKTYLSGSAKEVWIPDLPTQERRDFFHAHRKAVKAVTATNNSLSSYLSDNGVRLEKSLLELSSQARRECIQSARSWTPAQNQLLDILILNLEHALQVESKWASLLAQQVLQDPKLLELTRLCGIRDVLAFAIGAVVGDIRRFKSAKALVHYVGLNPAFDSSGKGDWKGGIGGHGHKQLRGLLIEAGHALLRSRNHPNADWGRALLARKGEVSLVVAALARKLITQVWYVLMGKNKPLEEITKPVAMKIGKMLSRVGTEGFKHLGRTRKDLRKQVEEMLLNRPGAREYIMYPDLQPPPGSPVFQPQPDPLVAQANHPLPA